MGRLCKRKVTPEVEDMSPRTRAPLSGESNPEGFSSSRSGMGLCPLEVLGLGYSVHGASSFPLMEHFRKAGWETE